VEKGWRKGMSIRIRRAALRGISDPVKTQNPHKAEGKAEGPCVCSRNPSLYETSGNS
jgi:hypothetical protein